MKAAVEKLGGFVKGHKKLCIFLGVVVIVVGAFALMPTPEIAQAVNVSGLARMDLENSVSLSGNVESEQSRSVYSTLSYLVESVNVEVGDQVKAGDVLAQLDTESLELDLKQQQASLNQTAASASQQVKSSEQKLENAEENLNSGLNQSIVSAQAQLRSAATSLSNAEESYYTSGGDIDYQIREARNSIQQAQNSLAEAQTGLDTAQAPVREEEQKVTEAKQKVEQIKQEIEAAQEKDPNADVSSLETQLEGAEDEFKDAEEKLSETRKEHQETITAAQSKVNSAQTALSTAQSTYDSLLRTSDSTHRQARQALDSAATAYDNAQRAYEAAVNAAGQEIESLETAVESSKVSANTEAQRTGIEKLEKTIEDATLTAPIDGTVTAVYAEEGVPGSGLLFVVENTDNLVIKTTIQEYDIADLEVGMEVIIQTDATGDEEYRGVISSISPTSQKGADGKGVETTTAVFDAEVTVTSKNTPLRVGMSAQMTVIIDASEQVFGVQYDAVMSDESGDYIFVARPDGENNYTVERIDVTTGLETDFFIEVAADGLAEGDYVITDPEGLTVGQRVRIGTGMEMMG